MYQHQHHHHWFSGAFYTFSLGIAAYYFRCLASFVTFFFFSSISPPLCLTPPALSSFIVYPHIDLHEWVTFRQKGPHVKLVCIWEGRSKLIILLHANQAPPKYSLSEHTQQRETSLASTKHAHISLRLLHFSLFLSLTLVPGLPACLPACLLRPRVFTPFSLPLTTRFYQALLLNLLFTICILSTVSSSNSYRASSFLSLRLARDLEIIYLSVYSTHVVIGNRLSSGQKAHHRAK